MAFSAFDSIGGKSGQAIADTSTTQKANLGTRVKAIDNTTYGEGDFIYLKGVASTVVGSVVFFNASTWQTTLTVARSKGPVAVAMSANVASQYGWYQIQGRGVAKTGTVVAGTACYTTSTGGQLDDAVVAGDEVSGMLFGTADGTPSAGLAEVSLQYPWVGDTDNT